MPELFHIDPMAFLIATGYVGALAVIFAESGLFFGFFLPGDSLLFSAGLLASQGHLDITLILLTFPIAAILGDSVGYWFGAKVGSALLRRPDSRFFKRSYVEETKAFYEKHGPKALVLARFIPIVRTFTPILAGVGGMRYGIFLMYNIIGGVVSGAGLTLLGYFLGVTVPGIDRFLLPIILFIIFISFLPVLIAIWKKRKDS